VYPNGFKDLIAKKVIYSSTCISICNIYTFNVFNMHYKKTFICVKVPFVEGSMVKARDICEGFSN
jgi:hypothetical protein